MPKKVDDELKARAVRLVNDHQGEYSSLTAAAVVDNFEWSEGYSQRFGVVVHVDFATLARTPKDSFAWYRDVIAVNRAESPTASDRCPRDC